MFFLYCLYMMTYFSLNKMRVYYIILSEDFLMYDKYVWYWPVNDLICFVQILREQRVVFGKNLDVTSYTDGKRETHNPQVEMDLFREINCF